VARRHPVAQDFLPDALIGGLDQRNFFVSEYGWLPLRRHLMNTLFLQIYGI
jgi:hypothetical protein